MQNFKDVDASRNHAGRAANDSGRNAKLQRYRKCDVHSALFHGETREEKIANAEKAVDASLIRQEELRKRSFW